MQTIDILCVFEKKDIVNIRQENSCYRSTFRGERYYTTIRVCRGSERGSESSFHVPYEGVSGIASEGPLQILQGNIAQRGDAHARMAVHQHSGRRRSHGTRTIGRIFAPTEALASAAETATVKVQEVCHLRFLQRSDDEVGDFRCARQRQGVSHHCSDVRRL